MMTVGHFEGLRRMVLRHDGQDREQEPEVKLELRRERKGWRELR